MSIFEILAEQRILDALRRGELDGLPGAGRPLDLREEPFVPAEQRMMNHILRNAGFAPPELGLRKQLAALRAELAEAGDEGRRAQLCRRVAALVLQIDEMRRARG